MSENTSPEKNQLSKMDLGIIVVLLLGIGVGIYGIYSQLKTMEMVGQQVPVDLTKTPQKNPNQKPSQPTQEISPDLSVLKIGSKAQEKGAAWLATQYLALSETKGGWPHFQWQAKIPGAPTTALAMIALTSLPKKLRDKYEKILQGGAAFLLSKMDKRGAISEEQAHIQYRNYTTAMTLIALLQMDSKKYEKEIQQIQKYLISSQLTSLPRWNWHYGTWNYYETPHLGLRVDISVTSYVLEALHKSGLPSSHEVFKKALVFLKRCQNYRPGKGSRIFDGGFAFHPRNSKAGEIQLEDGLTIYASYGSSSCDGLRGLLYCGLPSDSERVKAAKYWLSLHFAVDKNPGFPPEDPAGMARGIRFYYYHSLSKSLHISGLAGENYLGQLALYVSKLQRKNGSWKNDTNTMSEDYPTIASSFALLALNETLDQLSQKAKKEPANPPKKEEKKGEKK